MRSLPALVVFVLSAVSSSAATASTSPAAFQAKQDTTRRDSTAQTLGRLVIKGKATKRSGYTTPRSSFATKTDTPLRDTPQSVSIVNRQLIADQSMQNMADVVRYIPSITMGQGEGHRDAPTIRGNSSTADFFVDGIRDDAQYYRDTYNVERVEALKGSNAMIFGRGGGGGVINRVTKEAGARVRSLWLEGGSYDHRRGSIDIGQAVTSKVAARFNGMYENSGGFRDSASLERSGVNPTLAIAIGPGTTARVGYEYFRDHRNVDRGIPSFEGGPSPASLETFFGNPGVSYANARVHSVSATIDHATMSGLTLHNRTRFTHYDKFYQNVFPGSAVNAALTQVNLSGYNNAQTRANLFNQTEATYSAGALGMRHTLLAGVEVGRQATDNFRNTGYFENRATSFAVPFASPTVSVPVAFRQSATDADNHVVADVSALYAQDQFTLSRQWQAIAGVRYERFDLSFHNNRDGASLGRDDHMVSPRVGLVFKPVESVSTYGSYSVSHLPSSGDQFSSLNATTQTLEPERFTNYEVGAKWDMTPDLGITAATYRLDRSNSSARDPNDASKTVQTGRQRTSGYELGVTGNVTSRWQVAGGWATQRARILSATTSAREGATVPLVPQTMLSLWNRYQFISRLGGGVGVIHQTRTYAAIDNAVTLPGFTRVDAAAYVGLMDNVRLQLNVENVFDEQYYPTSQGNNNIMPGAPRTLRLGISTGF